MTTLVTKKFSPCKGPEPCLRVVLLMLSLQGEEIGYWSESQRLHAQAVIAEATGVSLDQLFFDSATALSFSANSQGSISHLPSIRKSSVTPKRSTSCAAT